MSKRVRDDVFVHMTDEFPYGIWEYVRKNGEHDGYDIYISTKQTIECQRRCYDHAMAHIENGDVDREDLCVGECEWGYLHGN